MEASLENCETLHVGDSSSGKTIPTLTTEEQIHLDRINKQRAARGQPPTDTIRPRGRTKKYQTEEEAREAMKAQINKWKSDNRDQVIKSNRAQRQRAKLEKEQHEELKRILSRIKLATTLRPSSDYPVLSEEFIRTLNEVGLGKFIWETPPL